MVEAILNLQSTQKHTFEKGPSKVDGKWLRDFSEQVNSF
jgi:hypothetical protein